MATITAGQLTEVIQFEIPTKTANVSGGQNEAYTQLCSTRGKVKVKDAFRSIENGYDANVENVEVYCYWRNDIVNNFTRDMKMIWMNKSYQIVSMESLERRWIKLQAQTVQ